MWLVNPHGPFILKKTDCQLQKQQISSFVEMLEKTFSIFLFKHFLAMSRNLNGLLDPFEISILLPYKIIDIQIC